MAGPPRLPPLNFPLEEIEALLLGARWVAERADPVTGEAARSAVARMMRALTPEQAKAMSETALFIGPFATDFDESETDPEPLYTAIRTGRRLALHYQDGSGESSERVIWPFATALYNRDDVLLGWCELRGDYRTFRIDRIVAARVLPDRYPRAPEMLLREWEQAKNVPHERFRLMETGAGEREAGC